MTEPRKSLYIETTIPSYATARASRDLILSNRQAITRLFWDEERHKYALYTSKTVIGECSDGDPVAAKRRLDLIDGIELAPENDKVAELATEYSALLDIPLRAKTDCAHLAICVVAKIDYILSWNCTDHIGPRSYALIYEYNKKRGLHTPYLFTPDSLIMFETGEDDPIVAEVHRVRAALWEEYGGIEGYMKHLREDLSQERLEAEGWRFVTMEEIAARHGK